MEESLKIYEADILKETVEILKYFDNDFLSKIPEDFFQTIKKASQNSNKEVTVDKTKKLEEQDISEECKDMISLIYYHYIATKEKRDELTKIWTNNEELYQKELKEKYSNNIFDTNIDVLKKEDKTEAVTDDVIGEVVTEKTQIMIVEEKNIFQKIIEYIKSLFKK